VSRACRVGGADRINPQLLAKFASKIRVSTHGLEATEAGRRPSAILPGVEHYRRRQRRRAIIAWSVASLLVIAIGSAIAFGGESETSSSPPNVSLFSSEMSSSQYDQIHKGQDEQQVINQLGTVGVQEAEAKETGVSELFPAPPQSTICSFWKLSDAPGHLVRLCFSDPQGVLVQKSVRAPGEGAGAETTLA
jgi:hypothetical protein